MRWRISCLAFCLTGAALVQAWFGWSTPGERLSRE